MGRPKGTKSEYTKRSAEEKYEIIKLVLEGEYSINQLAQSTKINKGVISTWIKKYNEGGIKALEDKRKPGNPLSKYQNKKELTDYEKLVYENMKLTIENERLKKGYTTEEVIKQRKKKS